LLTGKSASRGKRSVETRKEDHRISIKKLHKRGKMGPRNPTSPMWFGGEKRSVEAERWLNRFQKGGAL